jgi:hypothetical protein
MTLAEFRRLTRDMDEATQLATRVGDHTVILVLGCELHAADTLGEPSHSDDGWATFSEVHDPVLILKVGVRANAPPQ